MIRISPQYLFLRPYLDYILGVYRERFKVPEDLVFSYGEKSQSQIHVFAGNDVRFFTTKQSVPEAWDYVHWQNLKLPLFFQSATEQPLLSRDEQGRVMISADVLMNAFYHLSCWQETHSSEIDHYGRFPARASFLFQQGLLTLPLVDYFFDILNAAVEQLTGQKPRPKHAFTTLLSHDVDLCYSGWKENAFRAARDKRWLEVARILFKKAGGGDEWFNFESIIEFEKKSGVPATWFFLTTHRKRGKVPHADYQLRSAEMQNVLAALQSRKMEVAVHGRFGSGLQDGELANDLAQFTKRPAGNRFHFLAMRSPRSFDLIEKYRLQFDASLGFAEQAGFRAGTTHPYRPFNFRSGRAYSFWEIPLHIMDTSLIQNNYMGVTPEQALKSVRPVIEEAHKFSGVLSVLWHNTSFSGYKYRYWRSVFSQIITECKSKGSRFRTMSGMLAERGQ